MMRNALFLSDYDETLVFFFFFLSERVVVTN